MLAGKLDPTVDQLCFCRIFQRVRNLQKWTMEMSSEGLKWWKRGKSQPEMAGKHKNPATQVSGNRRVRWPDLGVSGGGWP